MKKYVLSAVLGFGLLAGINTYAAEPFTQQEVEILQRIDSHITENMNRILEGERTGSLKKPEVRQLVLRLNDITEQSYNRAKGGMLTYADENRFQNQVYQVGQNINRFEDNNLRYCRRISACPKVKD